MSETNDQQSEEQTNPATPEKAQLESGDVSETLGAEKSEAVVPMDVTGDVSEAYEAESSEAEQAKTSEEATSEAPSNEPTKQADAKPPAKKTDRDMDPQFELRQLMELAVKYPEIGPPLAELAYKIGHNDISERIVKMGLDDDETTGVEFFAVAIDVARREGRYEDVFKQVEDALTTFAETTDEAVTEDEANRLLHLVRTGFAVLLFDLEDVNAKPEWTKALSEQLPRLEARYADDPFFFSLLAQAHWFTDKERSETTWDKAVELSHDDFAWNARGTWYKDAIKDFAQAEAAYRKGLKAQPNSGLLLHNLAQLLTDEAEKQGEDDSDQARTWLREADELVRKALRQQTRRGLRRYVHQTKDRIRNMLAALPTEHRDPPAAGETVRGRVVALAQYGAFVMIAGGYKGLLHNTEIAHERVNSPNSYFKVGDKIQVKVLSVEKQEDDTVRIGFSRKALLPAPEKPATEEKPAQEARERKPRGDRNNNRRGGGGGGGGRKEGGNRGGGNRGGGNRGGKGGGGNRPPKQHRDNPRSSDGLGSLGEMLLAKLEEAKGQSDE